MPPVRSTGQFPSGDCKHATAFALTSKVSSSSAPHLRRRFGHFVVNRQHLDDVRADLGDEQDNVVVFEAELWRHAQCLRATPTPPTPESNPA